MFVLKTKYYLSYQDGRAEGDREYYSREEAEEALLKHPDGRGMNIVEYENREYDSEAETRAHIQKVSQYLSRFASILLERGIVHDASKLGPIEKPHFDRETAKLKNLVYGTPEYMKSLERLQVALRHHYAANSHHPEHYQNGVNGMTLVDLVEMLCDWKAASERNKGNKLRLKTSFERFNIDPQLAEILTNTAKFFAWEIEE